jgi:cytochrome c biogenesis protein CcmG, thiol:disulfide interchange protein DsbE
MKKSMRQSGGSPIHHPHRTASGSLPALVLLALATISACGGDGNRMGVAPVPGNPAPEYSARTLDGESLSLADLSGQVVVLNVWATWCGPCVREMPGLQELHEDYADAGLVVVGASVDRGQAEASVRRFLEARDLTFTILLDPDQTVAQRFRTLGVPETFLIGRDGVIAYRWIGEFDPTAPQVRERVEDLLAEEAA